MTPREWQNAFPPMPEMCHDALMNAVGSDKEEKKMKRTFRFAAVLAALLLVLTSAAYAVSRPQVLDRLLHRDAVVPLWLEAAAQTVDARASADGVNVSIDSLIYDGDMMFLSFETSVDDPTQALMIKMDNEIILNGESAGLYSLLTQEPELFPRPHLFDLPSQRNAFQSDGNCFQVPQFSGTVEAEVTFRIYRPDVGFAIVDENDALTPGWLDTYYGDELTAMRQDCRDAIAAMDNAVLVESDLEPWLDEGYTLVNLQGNLIAERDSLDNHLLKAFSDLHLTETELTLRFTFNADNYTVYDFSGVEVPRLRDAWVNVKTFRFSPLSCQVDVYLVPYINDTHVNVEHDSYLMFQEYGKAVPTDENGHELTYSDTYWSSGGYHCFIDKEGDEWCVRYSFTMPGLETLPESIGLTTKEGDLVRFQIR